MNIHPSTSLYVNNALLLQLSTQADALRHAYKVAEEQLVTVKVFQGNKLVRVVEPNTSLRLVDTLYRKLTEEQRRDVIQFIRNQLNGGAV